MLTITKTIQENAVCVALNGRLDSNTAPQLEQTLCTIAGKDLILDLAQLVYISSAGLRVLLAAQKKIKGQGEMKVIHVLDDVMDIFEVTGFVDILQIER